MKTEAFIFDIGNVLVRFDHMRAVASLSSLGADVSDRSEMEVIVEAPPSANLGYTLERAEAVAAIARTHPEVAYTYVTIGNAIPMRTPGVDQGQVFLKLTPKAERSLSQAELGAILRREFAAVAGVKVSVFTGGFEGAIKELQLEIRGPDSRVLTQLATARGARVRARRRW